MIQDLDDTLTSILNDPSAPSELLNAEVNFGTPDSNFAPEQATVNLFLYEVKENRLLRDPMPIIERQGDEFVRRQPPLRADCTYIVTTWSRLAGAAQVTQEHQLLSQALLWLSRFPVIPDTFLRGGLVDPPFPHPTMVAQMDGNKNMGEFWNALGSPPRPAFYLTVTIAMELGVQLPEGPLVVTKETVLKQKMPPGIPEPVLVDVFEIGGTVRNILTLEPIASAQVTLFERELRTTTDQEGRYTFTALRQGNYTLHVTADDFQPVFKAIVVPGPVLNAYDITLSP